MYVFKDVDIISSLRKIVDNNNLFYKTDFDYDVETLKKATEGSRFYWLSRNSGTYLINERNAHIRNSYDYNTWQYYSDIEYYGVKAFSVEITENEGGIPIGNIYELNYDKHREYVRKNSFNARTVDVTFKSAQFENEITRTIDTAEYSDNFRSLIYRYGEIKNVHHNLSNEDEALAQKILADSNSLRAKEAVPIKVSAYVAEMVKERFHDYGYKKDDMVFTTPDDAYAALRHKIPVSILLPDNTAFAAKTTKELKDAIHKGNMFGMSYRDKRLLHYYEAGNTLADLPFTHTELSAIFHMALDKGKDNLANEEQRKVIDGIIHVLDSILFSDDGRSLDEIELDRELDRELDDCMEQ